MVEFDAFLRIAADLTTVTLMDSAQRPAVFTRTPGYDKWDGPPGTYAVLFATTTGWRLELGSGTAVAFDSYGRLASRGDVWRPYRTVRDCNGLLHQLRDLSTDEVIATITHPNTATRVWTDTAGLSMTAYVDLPQCRWVRLIAADGNVYDWTEDAMCRITTQGDLVNGAQRFTYDGRNRVVAIEMPAGGVRTFA